MKIIALDLGDEWIGSAISDSLGMFARPYQTIAAKALDQFIVDVIKEHQISTIIVGYPKTMRGTESDQTKKIVAQHKDLAQKFPALTWILWDERMTSKQAATLKKSTSKEDKKKLHSVAAAIILQTYLDHLAFK